MESLLIWTSDVLLILGGFLLLTGGIGILRFPDLYTRMHAAGVTDTLAVLCTLSGLMLLAGWSLVLAKLLFVMIFLMFTGPVSSHALAKAAYNRGLLPKDCEAVGGESSTG